MRRLFGTDGVRGVANEDLTPDLALALGRAAGRVLVPDGGEVVVGRDTRLSGPMLEAALVAGLASAGVHVRTAGIVPTPAVAFLTVDEKAAAGAVISASHNPVPDNGIKFFSGEGLKVATSAEEEIERLMAEPPAELPTGADVGRIEPLDDAEARYVDHLLATLERPLTGLRVVLDCAYGAAFHVAPRAFREAGAEVTALHAEPDGARINVECGSTDLRRLAEAVLADGADVGLAFDGDADRVLAVDERGRHVDGDELIAMLALNLQERGALRNSTVVATVMANLGFRRKLEEQGIAVVETPVGDRFVAEEMTTVGSVLGGEQSGHIIFGTHSTTGDGVLAGLQIAQIVATSDDTLSHLAAIFDPYPQLLINVPVASKDGLETDEVLWEQVRAHEAELGDSGRILLRPSGTEPVIRVMVEAIDEATVRTTAEALADVVRERFS
jgi:phosphoglucosamine mutase